MLSLVLKSVGQRLELRCYHQTMLLFKGIITGHFRPYISNTLCTYMFFLGKLKNVTVVQIVLIYSPSQSHFVDYLGLFDNIDRWFCILLFRFSQFLLPWEPRCLSSALPLLVDLSFSFYSRFLPSFSNILEPLMYPCTDSKVFFIRRISKSISFDTDYPRYPIFFLFCKKRNGHSKREEMQIIDLQQNRVLVGWYC